MNVGDTLAVQIEGMDVGEATIENIENGQATLVIPATRLVVQVRQSLDLSATREPEVDRLFVGTEQPGTNESAATEAVNTPAVEQTQSVASQSAPAPTPAPQQIGAEYGSEVGEGIHGIKHFPGEMD